jgi:DNA helicase-2/ATP-dependent DNA helicase PcrA
MMRAVPVTDTETALRLGRGVIIAAGGEPHSAWAGAPRFTIDDGVLAAPSEMVDVLHAHWSRRDPCVIELRCSADELRATETHRTPPYALTARFDLSRERLYFLARANNYDDRDGRMRWGPGIEAQRVGALDSDVADVAVDGVPVWCDGGPRARSLSLPDGHRLVHRHTIEQGALSFDTPGEAHAELAPDQLGAVLHDAGPARIIAPAGSGKTRVLTERLRLLVARNWHPGSITAVAYNVRAKDTMRERLTQLPDAAQRRIRTLHSLGNAILRRGNGSTSLIDEWEMRRRIEALVPVKPRANTDVYAPYLEALGAVRLGLVDPNVVEAQRDDVAGFGAMFDEYRDKLHADGAIDYDEQIYGAVEVLLRMPEVRYAFQRECRHLLVDEFQDLTPAQLLMLRLVAAPAFDTFGVGDDDQVIYGYAGADPEFLINYDRYFPGGTHHALHTNYRCPAPVVTAARNVLSYNRRRIDKEIVAAKPDDASDDVLTSARVAPERIGLAAIEQATKWLAAGAAPHEIAVLSRVNASLLPVQLLFGEANVPCWTPVSLTVLNRTGTRTALAYLRLAIAARADGGLPGADVAVAARRPSRSIRREILQRFERRRRWSLAQLRDAGTSMNANAADRFDTFCSDIEALGRAIESGATTDELLLRIRDDIGLGAALATLDLSGKGPDASHRDDLNALIAVAAFEPDPAAFEPWLRTRLRDATEQPRDEGVAVSTVHRVKGMEWPYVVVLGAHDGLMPHTLADDIEEERRIFHVAITRADTSVHVVADAKSPAPFLDQLGAPAPAGYAEAVRRRPEPKPASTPASTAPPGLVAALKSWRAQRARDDKVPAYIVLSDAHLAGIAARAPSTLDELARCAGIGPTKLERYGDEIIATLADA